MLTADDLAGSEAIFSPCGAYRVWLKRGSGGDLAAPTRRILWGLCNPSVAGSARADGSIRSDKTISTAIGFGERLGANEHGFLNLLSRIGTDPSSLYGVTDPDGPQNAEAWSAAFDWLMSSDRPTLIFAWGGKLWTDRIAGGRELLNARSVSIARAFRLADEKLITPQALGLTANGSPRHPSRLGYDDGLAQLTRLNGAFRRRYL